MTELRIQDALFQLKEEYFQLKEEIINLKETFLSKESDIEFLNKTFHNVCNSIGYRCYPNTKILWIVIYLIIPVKELDLMRKCRFIISFEKERISYFQ